jgi:2,3-bisphosphoglycerate-dependent phosphoglycerate mutase
MKGRVLFVRHGETAWNRKETGGESAERIRGWKDVPLDANGLAEAKKVGRKVKNMGIARIYSSDLSRAFVTAQHIAYTTRAPVRKTKDLRPWDLGDLTGKPVSEVLHELKTLPGTEDKAPPGGEPFKAFRQRALGFIAKVVEAAKESGATLCIVTHTRDIQATRAWAAKGFPSDLSIDLDVMNDYSHEASPGGALELDITGEGKEALRKVDDGV